MLNPEINEIVNEEPRYTRRNFTKVPNEILYSPLPANCKVVYESLLGYVFENQGINDEPIAFPSLQSLARRLEMSEGYLSKTIKKLANTYHLLEVEKVKTPTGQRNRYHIKKIPDVFYQLYEHFDGSFPYHDRPVKEKIKVDSIIIEGDIIRFKRESLSGWEIIPAKNAVVVDYFTIGKYLLSYSEVVTASEQPENVDGDSVFNRSQSPGRRRNRRRPNKDTSSIVNYTSNVTVSNTEKYKSNETVSNSNELDLTNKLEEFTKNKENWNTSNGILKSLLESLNIFLEYPMIGKIRKENGDEQVTEAIKRILRADPKEIGNPKVYFLAILRSLAKKHGKGTTAKAKKKKQKTDTTWYFTPEESQKVKEILKEKPELADLPDDEFEKKLRELLKEAKDGKS